MPGGPEMLVIFGIIFVTGFLLAFPSWFICKRAGLSPWMAAIAFIPSGVGIVILLFILAFVRWPSLAPDPATESA